jgi:hypothetical protein
MINNNCSTDFIEECLKDDFPYKVVMPNTLFGMSIEVNKQYEKSDFIPLDDKVHDRFELLDIKAEQYSTSELTVTKIINRINKLKKEADGIWKVEEKTKIGCSEEDFIEMVERYLQEDFKKLMDEYVKNTMITNRFEILDL